MGLRIIFAGTPPIAATLLQAILHTPHEVVAVLTQPDRPAGRGQQLQASAVKSVALDAGVSLHQPQTLRNNTEMLNTLSDYHADVMIVLGYGLLLPESVLTCFPLSAINFHTSLLPRGRGASPITQAILAGDQQTGLTIMKMSTELDAGDILLQFPCDITENETTASLTEKLAELGAAQVASILNQLENHTLISQPQDLTQVTYAPKLTKAQAKIDWTKSALEIARQVRGLNPWPVAYTTLDGKDIRIWSAQALPTENHLNIQPGALIHKSIEGFDILTAQGILRVTEMQLPGKSRITCAELVKTKHPLFQKEIIFA